ncbi:putative protein OS=Streptomyces fumanus OX=67302 GN=GCM10018772_24990 PE=4 SV=1 [Streptomyces fumanus]|uniref:Uncharacterized protein n=1 Tax=Streptomyces fumanus TaxID=67302 RepID=A0A919E0Z5_9ACTN|nr:hypothetical protein GCM10018772_24990 [Streptomyces fumanus]
MPTRPAQITKCLLGRPWHVAAQPCYEFVPDQLGTQMLEQAESQDEVDPDSGWQTPQSFLAGSGLLHHRIYQLRWDDLG